MGTEREFRFCKAGELSLLLLLSRFVHSGGDRLIQFIRGQPSVICVLHRD